MPPLCLSLGCASLPGGSGIVVHRHSDAVQLDGGTDYRRMHAEEDDAPVRAV